MNAAKKTSLNGSETRQRGGAVAALLIIFIIAMVANFGYSVYQSSIDDQRLKSAEELRVLSQQISNNASESVGGNVNAFDFLAVTRNTFERNFQLLERSILETDFKFTPIDGVSTALNNTRTLWSKVQKNSDTILESRNTVLDLHDVAGQLSKTVPQLQDLSENVVAELIKSGGSANQLRHAARQVWYAERLLGSVQKILSGESGAKEAASDFEQNIRNFGDTVDGMLNGDANKNINRIRSSSVRTVLEEIAYLFQSVKENSGRIIDSTQEIYKVHTASDFIFKNATTMLELTGSLANAFKASTESRLPGNPLLSAGLLVVVMLLLGILYIQQRSAEKEQLQYTGEKANKEKEQNERNQEAIIRLLDEMEGLADGDLTAHATVTEDFTGAIADAMNYTIDQLRSLVSAINNTVVQVSSSSTETRSTASELAQASRNQAQEIKGASAAISEMASSIEQVSNNASETTDMAQESVAIAKSGGDIVRNTIRAMDTIREQIQETSKRIKRLGESSQEIGDIVALINDISDQTNILALNAAIQATMAGEAGRGFAVVSDEVQRLAERSGNAAKQIEGLVKTIQTDTNQAVISMESSTAEVVSGARLAQDAGVALERIEAVSNDVAGLITNISETARTQAASAGQVTNTMMVIQDITTNTAAGTEKTADSIGNLADLADELKESVAGFKLPE
ncbi:MAG: chemotaxis protein [Gammaproteobacteria bacterium]|nr:MAG: chemotaxis protein [Gammaproteobacteria bacterium]